MRSNAQLIFEMWSDPTFQPIGVNAPRSIVTCDPSWVLATESENLGSWPSNKKPVRWFQRADNSQEEFEIPNVGAIQKNRGLSTDAATCTITLANQWMKTNWAVQIANELGYPGYFTFNRGASSEAQDRWGHVVNEWSGRLVPGALLRTYQGYGGHDLSREDAVEAGNLLLTGIWIVDEVTIGAKTKQIELQCRDMAALLIDQVIYPPLIPPDVYPLIYERWSYAEPVKKDWTVTVQTPITVPTAMSVQFSDSSVDHWYPTASPGSAIGAGGFVLHGHKGSDALDGVWDSYWLSVGNSHPSRPFCTDFWQVAAGGQMVSQVEVTPWRGPYTMYVSIMEDGNWVGGDIVPYDFATLEASQPGSTDTGADIPYVMAVGTGVDAAQTVTLPRSYRAQQIRLSFRGHVDSGIGPWVYRCGVREFKALGGGAGSTVLSETSIVPVFWAAAHVRDPDFLDRTGYVIGTQSGKVQAFGDCREVGLTAGNLVTNAFVTWLALNRHGDAYWTLRGDGSVSCYGAEAAYFGSPKDDDVGTTGTPDTAGNYWSAICPTPTDQGYWCVATDGRIRAYGDATPYTDVALTPGEWVSSANPLVTGAGLFISETDGTIHVRGSATHFGNYTKTTLTGPIDCVAVLPTVAGDGYWILAGDGHVQECGAATFFGEQVGTPTNVLEQFDQIIANVTDEGYILVRNDGTAYPWGDIEFFGSPATSGTLRSDGNYLDYSDIIKDLALWCGFWLQEIVPLNGTPDVYGNIETTGIYSPTTLPPDMFDKKSPIDPMKQIKEIVGFLLYVDDQGALRFTSPNWWQSGNWFETGEHTAFIPEIDETVQLTDLTARFSKAKDRSEIIITTDEPTAGFTDTVTTRYTPSNSLLRGMVVPAMIRVPPEVSSYEQQVMAELIALHLWFARRATQITILANPAIGIDDQVRVFERVTGEVYTHYIRESSDTHDLKTGVWRQTLTTNWLGSENGTWAITGENVFAGAFDEPATDSQFVISNELAKYLDERARRLGLEEPVPTVTTDLDSIPGSDGSATT